MPAATRLLSVIRWLLPLALIAALALAVEPARVMSSIADTDGRFLILALVVVQVQIILAALRWAVTARRLGHSLSFANAVGEYYLASLGNMVLPGGVAGDAVRAARTHPAGHSTHSWTGAVQAIALERAAGQAAFVVLLVGGLGTAAVASNTALVDAGGPVLLGVLCVFAALAACFVVAARALPTAAGKFLRGFGPALRRVYGNWRDAAFQACLSMTIAASYVAVFGLTSAAVGAVLDPLALVTVVPLALLTMMLPVSIGGWGVREAACAALWPLVGFAAADGIGASVLYGLVVTAGAVPGLAWAVLAPRMRAGCPDHA